MLGQVNILAMNVEWAKTICLDNWYFDGGEETNFAL